MQRVVFHEAELQLAEVIGGFLADLPGEQEIHTFDDGKFGSFTKKQRLEIVHLCLADLDNFNETSTVFENICFAFII